MKQQDRIRLPFEDRHITVLLERHARERADKPFLTIEGKTYSYRAAWERVMRVAAGLSAAGIGEGDRVGVMLPNCEAFVLIWFAAAHLGATTVVMNPQLRGAMLDSALHDAECKLLVIHATGVAALESKLAGLLDSIKLVAVVGTPALEHAGLVPFERLLAGDGGLVARRGDYRTIQTIAFTSGSTGPSKGVLVTNNQALDTACTFIHAMALTEDDVIFTPFALFHGMSNRLATLPALVVGAHVVVAEKFSASGFWRQVTECKATIAQTLNTVTALLKAQPPGPFDRAHSVTRMYNSRYDEEFERRFGVHLVEAYGMTEFGVVTYTPYPERRTFSAGKVHPDWEMRIVDEDDRPVAPGEAGEMVFRPSEPFLVCAGYARRPEATVEATRNLWFHTGDVARQDADGFVFFMDRKKERIRRRGENISSFDVELFLSSHPDIRECAVMPYPAEHGEDEVRIIIVKARESSLDAPMLYAWLQGVMPRFMLPRYIEFADTLPRTHNDKIEKHKLLAAGLGPSAWDREAAQPAARATEK